MMSAESNSEKSVSYQKKDGRGHAHPSFFWYDNYKDLKVYLNKNVPRPYPFQLDFIFYKQCFILL